METAKQAPDSSLAAWIALVLIPVAIYVAFWPLGLGVIAGIGFVVIVPSLIASIGAAIAGAAKQGRAPHSA